MSLLSAAFGASAARGEGPVPGKIHPRLAERMAKSDARLAAWVYFSDKPGARPETPSPRAAARRAKSGYRPGSADAPVDAAYLAALREAGASVRTRSKWLNAAAVVATPSVIERIAGLPFVTEIREVASFQRPPMPLPVEGKGLRPRAVGYGLSSFQLQQIQARPLLEAGFTGKDVHILMLDSGFYTGTPCFSSMQIERRRDFVAGDDVVEGIGYEEHGTQTLSVIGAYDPGWIVGPAHGATYYLARTEDDTQEVPAEEDHWIAAIEWGESLGVDLASSSLGYNGWYTYEDMDGETAPISVAAQAAVERGVVVVNSAGNEGDDPWRYVIAPADANDVLAIGAVNINGDRVSFSSFGPTADGRIKPDLAALGSGVAGVWHPRLASPPEDVYCECLSGTSFSAPLVAGACALLLEVHPTLTPALLAAALRATASRSEAPDNELGWGIVNAYRAALPPVVRHDPLTDTAWDESTGYTITLTASLFPGFDSEKIVFGGASSFSDTLPLTAGDENGFSGLVPWPAGDPIRYYFLFTRRDSTPPDTNVVVSTYTVPETAPLAYYEIGDATPPVIVHDPIGSYPLQAWPPEVVAVIRDADAVVDDSVYVDFRVAVPEAKGGAFPDVVFPLERRDDSTFAGSFPSIQAEAGASVLYRIHACDPSGNCSVAPETSYYSTTLFSVTHALLYGTEGDEGPANPFVAGAGEPYRILFDLPVRETVRIRIYDVAGRFLRQVANGPMGPGTRLAALWDGEDASGRRVQSGVYFLRFEAGSFTATRKMVVLR